MQWIRGIIVIELKSSFRRFEGVVRLQIHFMLLFMLYVRLNSNISSVFFTIRKTMRVLGSLIPHSTQEKYDEPAAKFKA